MTKKISVLDYGKYNSFLRSTLKYYKLENIKVKQLPSTGDIVRYAITCSYADGIYHGAIIISYNVLTNQVRIKFGRFRLHHPLKGEACEFPNDYLDMIVEIKYEGRKLLPENSPAVRFIIEL